jgi:2'-5' RNA ligase
MQHIVRTFLAVELSPETRGRALRLIQRLRATGARVRWVEGDNLHVTLKFLGDVESVELPEVCRRVQAAVADLTAFDLVFRGAGAFPDVSNPRTLWLGVADGEEPMAELHRRVEDALGEIGFRIENRRFKPHVTIGRVRDTRDGKRDLEDLLLAQADFDGGVTHVEEVVVFASYLHGDGPEYEVLGRGELLPADLAS